MATSGLVVPMAYNQSALDVAVAVGVDAVVAGGAGIDCAAADGQVASTAGLFGGIAIRRIDGIVRGIHGHLSACDIDIGLTLDALAASTCGGDADDCIVADSDGTVDFDALGRRLIVAVVAVELA